MITKNTTLKEQYKTLKIENPRLRIRQAANLLHVSELELLELQLGDTAVRLKGDWKKLLKEVHTLGKVMALTRNEYAVHERKGIYNNISFMKNGRMGVAVNEDIDLRFLMWEWEYAYAVKMPRPKGSLFSFQFFNKAGEAIHKIYLTNYSDPTAYHKLLESYKAKDQQSKTIITPCTSSEKGFTELLDKDIAAFQQEWLNLKDTHDFFPLLRKYELKRLQALRLAPEGYAYQVNRLAVVQMFKLAKNRTVPIMIFVNSKGCIQIHTGEIKRLVPMEGWFNIMDPDFNLHLKLEGIAETWVVKKPTADGVVTGLEVFDAEGNMVVYCFGKRKPGIPELEEWRGIVRELSTRC